MPFDTWLLYVATVLALMSTPGPSQLLMLSNSASNGLRRGSFTAMGDLMANVLQTLAAGLGLAALIVAFDGALTLIKFAGAVYLVWLGARMIRRAKGGTVVGRNARTSLRKLWLQGFVTSAANPKAIVFFAALFPHFISSELPFWPQFVILSATYIAIDGAFLTAYGGAAHWLASKLRGPARAWVDRVGGATMIGAAVLLGFKTVGDLEGTAR